MLKANDIEFLKTIFMFYEKLTNDEKNLIALNTVKADYEKGKTITNNENECNGIVILKSGQLRTYIISDEGKEITLYRLLSRDVCIMTASCVLKNITFSVQLEVEKESVLFFLPTNIWSSISNSNVLVKEYALELISSRFSEVMWVMEQVVFMGMGQRLSAFLLEQAALEQSYSIAITHDTIAKNLGTAREVISRLLKYFENEGLIELLRGSVKLLDVKKLRRMNY
jgi:CRP/FNR family transcriptional regulator